MNNIVKVIFGVFGVIVVILGITAGPFIYNYTFHPLARINNQISNRDSIENVRNLLKKYEEKHEKNDILQFVDEYPDPTCGPLKRENVMGCLSLYDESIFDDVQLAVYFDKDGKVVDKMYIGD